MNDEERSSIRANALLAASDLLDTLYPLVIEGDSQAAQQYEAILQAFGLADED